MASVDPKFPQPPPPPDSSLPPGKPLDIRKHWSGWSGVVPSRLRWACMIWVFIKFGVQFILCCLQSRVLQEKRRMPRILFGRISTDSFEMARNYNLDLIYLEMFSCLYWILYEIWTILYAGFTTVWFLSGPLLETLGVWPDDWDQETGESIVFIILCILISNMVSLPLQIYKTFVIEETYGFNKMSPEAFFLNFIKLIGVECVWSTFTGIVILWIVRAFGQNFFFWVWLFSFVWLMTTVAIYPNFIAPIFDTYTPLREGRLKDRLHRLAHFIGFPLDEVLVMHQSWRSEHRDAYFYGLLNSKRIVLYDTLLTGYPEADLEEHNPHRRKHNLRRTSSSNFLSEVPSRILHTMNNPAESRDESRRTLASRPRSMVSRVTINDIGFTEYELEAIVARLMGQWVMSHALWEIILPNIALFIFFLIFSYLYQNSSLFLAFEVPTNMDKPILLGLRLLFLDVMDVYTIAVAGAMLFFSRRRQFEADSFAVQLGYGDDLVDAIIELNKENLNYPYFDEWYWAFHYSKPSLLARIENIQLEMMRMEWRNR